MLNLNEFKQENDGCKTNRDIVDPGVTLIQLKLNDKSGLYDVQKTLTHEFELVPLKDVVDNGTDLSLLKEIIICFNEQI